MTTTNHHAHEYQSEALPSQSAIIEPTHPEATLSYYLRDENPTPDTPLVVLVCGLALPMQSWATTVSNLCERLPDVSILAYDRWDRGKSRGLPVSRKGVNDISTAGMDLGLLLNNLGLSKRPLIMVGQSMGCPIIRMYAIQTPTANIRGVVFIDSMMANSDFISVFPAENDDEDPDLTSTRQLIIERFHPSVQNTEGISRMNAAQLLPFASTPRFPTNPHLIVLGHDPEYFAQFSEKSTGMNANMVKRYLQPAWETYNEGLLKLSDNAIGDVRIVPDSGHFIQMDQPGVVVDAILEVLAGMAGS
jgi:pimeloyl-ACP methyl ester carboxylesterase